MSILSALKSENDDFHDYTMLIESKLELAIMTTCKITRSHRAKHRTREPFGVIGIV